MNWIKTSDIPAPQVANYTVKAEFMLDYDVYSMLQNPISSVRNYPNQQSLMAEMIQYAFSLTQNNFQLKLAPPDWNWAMAGIMSAEKFFNYLAQLPMNSGDPNTASVLTAWQTGKLDLYGGHDPIAVNTGDGFNVSTGPSSVPAGTIFGGSKI